MIPSKIDRLLAQLHGVIGEARLVSVDDPRWGVYWTEAQRLSDMVDALVPEQSRPLTTNNGRDQTRGERLQEARLITTHTTTYG